ncbi:hypothetical protein HYPSUDRAFT_54058 [Hypholoma sublateritium FD-334 SS-4]|uniref:Uncharacterized protein n=1 Tax=Hypholoma sublateritium (strain FD-334 SS-4) TaxID=945553 RepID=A0A0D2L9H6_HYPSF|nr:hypothetical protein HYPSUDRAFT_54058 [Hypholoma sublateritium FD-334 SS-4]
MTKIKHEVVNWAKDPTKDQRLLDWLDENETEREVLFSITGVDRKNPGKTLSGYTPNKKLCGERAAAGIFLPDVDHNLWLRCQQYPEHYGQVVIYHINYQWKEKYRVFNNKIGAAASILPYSEIRVDGELHMRIEKLMEDEFPYWSRLHLYWRTNPYYNTFYNSPSKAPNKGPATLSISLPKRTAGNSASTGVMTRKRKLEDSGASVPRPGSSKNSPRKQFIVVEDSPSPRSSSPDAEDERGESSSKDAALARITAEYKGRKRDRKDSPPRYQGPEGSGDTALTASQRHELRMAEIQLRRQELELEIQEKKSAAEMRRAQIEAEAHSQREKHELMMRLMEFVTGAGEAGGSK